MIDMSKNSLYLSNYTRSGRAFFLYLVGLCPNLQIDPGGSGRIQKTLRTITIVRDPRDVIPSSIINSVINDLTFKKKFTVEMELQQHLYFQFYRELLKQHDLIVIDFNDLVSEPEKTLEAIHKLLEIPFLMGERDINKTFNEGIHVHTSKTHPEYDKVKELSDKKDYSFSLSTMNKVLEKKLQVL
jgi:hypothetical protein